MTFESKYLGDHNLKDLKKKFYCGVLLSQDKFYIYKTNFENYKTHLKILMTKVCYKFNY